MGNYLVARSQANVPEYMRGDDTGTDKLKQYQRPGRVKVVHKMAGEKILKSFGHGDIIVVPTGLRVSTIDRDDKGNPADEGKPFHFVPVGFYVEWCLWNDIKSKGSAPAVLARSMDPKSKIARLAQSPDTWIADHPTAAGLKVRYVEHLNFIVLLLDAEEAPATPTVMSFFKGSHEQGVQLSTLINLRSPAPMYGCVFEGRAGRGPNTSEDYYVIYPSNPSEESGVKPFLEQADYEFARDTYKELAELVSTNEISVDFEDDDETIDVMSESAEVEAPY